MSSTKILLNVCLVDLESKNMLSINVALVCVILVALVITGNRS